MNKDLRALEGECEVNTNKEVKTIDEPTETLYSKIKTNEVNWEGEYKRLKDEADVMCKELDQAQRELECKNRELIQLKEKFSDLRRDKDYLNGKTCAYEYAIRYLGTEKRDDKNEMV